MKMRLIDADNLIEGRIENDPVVIAVKCAPTAYDLDKVIDKLRKEIGDCQYECEKCKRSIDCDTCRAERAVEIAKEGGVNE